MTWLYVIIILLLAGTFLYWLLIVTEGVYLGRRVVVWLYDKTADTYDQIKEYDPEFERESIGEPLLTYLGGIREPFVLDVATGTGRVPMLLISDDRFQGSVIGLDAATGMLSNAQDKLKQSPAGRRDQVMFVQQFSDQLPFPNGSFDMVTCLEALEFFPSEIAAVDEMVRVLRPGGLLMTTRRQGWEARFFFGRYRSEHSLSKLLAESGLTNIDFYPWQVNYDMVVARKIQVKRTGPSGEDVAESARSTGEPEEFHQLDSREQGDIVMSIVRWGLLSTANINRRVIPAIRASERGELVAIASRNQRKATDYASTWQIPVAYGSYEEMLASGEVDAVYISLPNHLHAEWSIKALEAGINVLCEKPFALSIAEVDQMISAAERTGKSLAEAFMYRHHPQTKLLGDWLRRGKLGEITYLQALFNFTGMKPENVRLIPEMGGGALWDVGVYPVSLAQYVMGGPPEWVVGDQRRGDSGVDMVFSGQLHYSGGRTAHISCSFQTPFYTYAQIIGTEGSLRLTRPFVGIDDTATLLFIEPGGETEDVPVPGKELYLGEVEDMNAAILDGSPNYLTLAESRDHIRTVLALYESAYNNSAVVKLGKKGI